jgi:hypothetical protein
MIITHQYNKLDQSLAGHENTNSEALSPHKPVESCGERTTCNLCNKGNSNDANNVSPGDAIVQ